MSGKNPKKNRQSVNLTAEEDRLIFELVRLKMAETSKRCSNSSVISDAVKFYAEAKGVK